jgi:hypothetical protein
MLCLVYYKYNTVIALPVKGPVRKLWLLILYLLYY